MKKIQLTGGKFAVIDDCDFEEISKHKWHLCSNGYAQRTVKKQGRNKTIKMHRQIIGTPLGMDTDHKNGDRLDNRRVNLRACNRSENISNKPMTSRNKTGVKGITIHTQSGRFQAQIGAAGKYIYLGLFKTIEAARRARKKAEKEFHKFVHPKFACIILILAMLISGCGTQAPSTNKQKQASFDVIPDTNGNVQNSGVLEFTNHQAVITPTARARYNFLILAYGSRIKIVPALAMDDGLTPCDTNTLARFHATNLWFMDKLHLQYWATLNTFATMPPATLKKNP